MFLQGGAANVLQSATAPKPTIKGTTAQSTIKGTTIQPAMQVQPEPTLSLNDPSNTQRLSGAEPAPDPYAQWGGQTAYDNLVSGFDTQKDNIYSTANDSAENAFIGRKSNILDFLLGMQQGQDALNNRAVQNELAKKQGYTSVMDMVGRGLRSGATMLANRNAADSSAGDALAMAYGNLGTRELGRVGNAYALENFDIGNDQTSFDQSRAAGLRKLNESEQQTVNNIVIDARNKLAALDADMANASLPNRIAMQQEQDKIRAQVADILDNYDAQLQSGYDAIAPSSLDARRQKAFELANAGVAADNPLNLSANIPLQFQNTGPQASSLPLFTLPRSRREG